jgi:integrase
LIEGFIKPRLGATALDRLDGADIWAMLGELATRGRRDGKPGGLSPTTRKHIYRCLCAALNSAVELKTLARNPCAELRKKMRALKSKRAEPTVLNSDQTAEMLTAIRGRRIYWPVLLAVTTGARRSEILALTWRNVDLEHGTVTIAASVEVTKAGTRIKPPKSGKARTVALPAFAVAELRRHRVEQAQELLQLGVRLGGETLVCGRADGSLMLPTSLTHEWQKIAPTIDGATPRLHDLRHGHATQLLGDGVPLIVVSQRLGHSGIAITADTYAHVTATMQEEAAAKLDKALGGAITAGSAG